VTDAELRNLLQDCLRLWQVTGRVTVTKTGIAIETPDGIFTVTRAAPDLRPVRWFHETPERAAAGRPARATPSIVALLSALRNAMQGSGGSALRIAGA